MKKILSFITLTVIFCITICGLSNADSKTLKVGVTADYPPFEFTKNGQLQGFSIDFAKKLGEAMGKKVEFKDMSFSALIPSLQSRKIDMIISSINVTEERKKNVDFSTPYYSSIFSLLSLKSSSIKSVEELENKIVGVQLGSTMEEFAKNISKQIPFKILALDSNLMLIQELNKKIIDTVIVEEVQGKEYTQHHKNIANFKIPEKYYQNSDYAIALRKGSPSLEVINNIIKEFKDNGTLNALKQKWIK